jgi:hypothetical protein
MRSSLAIAMLAAAAGQRFGGITSQWSNFADITSQWSNFADAAVDNPWFYHGSIPSPVPPPVRKPSSPLPVYNVHGTQGPGERWNEHGTERACDSPFCK